MRDDNDNDAGNDTDASIGIETAPSAPDLGPKQSRSLRWTPCGGKPTR